jgi:hypothetical protein
VIRRSLILLITLVFAAPLLAATGKITGQVTNQTTAKPSAGDTVILLNLGEGMDEAGRTRTDARGHFSFDVDTDKPHLVRVVHQGVTYHAQVMPGETVANVEVFDVSKQVDGVSLSIDLVRAQTNNDQLVVDELFVLTNTSKPGRTLLNDTPFEFYLPPGAQVESAEIQAPGGMPLRMNPVPEQEKDRYTVVFPIRPGETRLQIAYHLPYNGKVDLSPRLLSAAQHFAVMAAPGMTFSAADAGSFQSMNENGSELHVALNVKPGQKLAYSLSGSGAFPPETEGGETAANPRTQTGPGGGIGAPEATPDPLEKYRWWIFGVIGLLFVAGAGYALRHPAPAPEPVKKGKRQAAAVANAGRNGHATALLEVLKEELFQLEIDRHEGRLTAAEYDKHRAALELTIRRAVSRQEKPATAAK